MRFYNLKNIRLNPIKIFQFLIFGTALIAVSYSVFLWVYQQHGASSNGQPSFEKILSGLIFLTGSALLLEKFIPLNAISRLDWIYYIRPSKKVNSNLMPHLLQLVAFSFLGLLVGAANNSIWLFLIFSPLFRLIIGVSKKRSIPNLLTAGKKKLLTEASIHVLDSSLIANVMATTHLKWKEWKPTSNYLLITLRRFYRRPYIALAMLVAISFAYSFSDIFEIYTLPSFIILWSLIGVDIARCADFSKLGAPSHYRIIALLFHSGLAIAIIFLTIAPQKILLSILLIIFCILWTGIMRSRPRVVDQITFIDSGIVGPVSPELIRFYLCGLIPNFLACMILVFYAV